MRAFYFLGVSMSNYGTVAGADSYHAARGNNAWSGWAESAKLSALTRASTYVDGLGQRRLSNMRFISLFPGTPTGGRLQELAWPRSDATDMSGVVIDPATVPREVEYATYEAALRELQTPGILSPDYRPGSIVKREKLDVIETEYQPVADSGDGKSPVRPVLTVVADLLAPVMTAASLTPWPLTV